MSEKGKAVTVDPRLFEESVHAGLACTDCHDHAGRFDELPHYPVYHAVDCGSCHPEAAAAYHDSFHGRALLTGQPEAPNCQACHGQAADPHAIEALGPHTAEGACRRCHGDEARAYRGSVHQAAAARGEMTPGCTSCHPTHGAGLPPSAGAVNTLCAGCHEGTMESVVSAGHLAELSRGGVMSCASCHDAHATHKPELDEGVLQACYGCHPDHQSLFEGSVHEDLVAAEEMHCLTCHRGHQVLGATETEEFGCGACHSDVEEVYRGSAHRQARLRGDLVAAHCGDCHGGHHVLSARDGESPVNHFNIPDTCGRCHTGKPVITEDFVRLPVSLPSYLDSIHGQGWERGEPTAVCSDCHGDHDLYPASDPESRINKNRLASTCGRCHADIAAEYQVSVHGRALAHGVSDSPSCTDCHDEHLILATESEGSGVARRNQAKITCAHCHEDPEMAARYGFQPEVVGSYLDSYHGWAIARDGGGVATCEDCHNKHEIRSPLDPESSIHPKNVAATCGRCHENSNEEFAISYSHIAAHDTWQAHDWVRFAYIWLIVGTLGGMALHNGMAFWRELRTHYREYHAAPTVQRMNRSEVVQHMILALTFTVLAITGFALRYPEAWWVELLSSAGMTETVRRLVHRAMALLMVGASLYHVWYMLMTRRGRHLLVAILPRMSDVKEAWQALQHYAGRREKPPTYATYDYTQKAEYWALVWGTIVMTVTGFVLMFPVEVTAWVPAWVVRVAETIHFYEAILAVGAIIIWHLFFVIVLPREYPMSWIWLSGRMPLEHYEHHHGRAEGDLPEEQEGGSGASTQISSDNGRVQTPS